MSQAAEVINYDYGQRPCLECGVMFQVRYGYQLTCGDECKKNRERKQKRVRGRRARAKQKEVLATLEAKVKKLEAELTAKLTVIKLSEHECAELKRALEAAKKELADMEQSYARIKEQFAEWKAKNGLDKPREVKEPEAPKPAKTKAQKTDAATFDKAVEAAKQTLPPMQECKRMSLKATSLPCGQREECYAPLCDKLPKTLPKGVKLCKGCKKPFLPEAPNQSYCTHGCRKNAWLGINNKQASDDFDDD